MTFTGDLLLSTNEDGDMDTSFQNGQPIMTDGFETCVVLAVFGEKCVLNMASVDVSEAYDSTFSSVIRHATVTDSVRQDGEKAIEKALAFLVTDGAASKVTVTGQILSARSIGWLIEIVAPNGVTKYAVNWEKGALTAGFSRIGG